MKKLLKNIVIVFLGILLCFIILFSLSVIVKYFNSSADINNTVGFHLYIALTGEINLFIPFYIFYTLFDFAKDYLIKKDKLFKKLLNQILLGIMFIIIFGIMYGIIIKTGFDQTWESVIDFMSNYTIILIFTPIAIVLDFLYFKHYKKDKNETSIAR